MKVARESPIETDSAAVVADMFIFVFVSFHLHLLLTFTYMCVPCSKSNSF